MTIDRRAALRSSSVAFGAIALAAIATGTTAGTAQAVEPEAARPGPPALLPDPSRTQVPNPPYPAHLAERERAHLETFDELDFVVFSNAQWNRMHESHASTVRVHYPDGHYTDGLDKHIADLQALFVWTPDATIHTHPIRIAKDNLTAVTGVWSGTFSKPMPDGKGGFVKPTGKKYSINMVTIGSWNCHGTMDEEWLFYDNATFSKQIGLA